MKDYTKDGILYCGKCNTPKQIIKVLFNGKEIKPSCLCACEQKRKDEIEERERREEYIKKIKDMRVGGFPDKDLRNYTFENDDNKTELSKVARNYVKNFGKTDKGILMYGTVGTGKTFSACCIANALIDKGIPCLVTNFPRLVNEIQSTYDKQNYIDSLNKYKLLVIDDLASERDTEFMNEIVMNVIDSRYRAKLPLIVTTNLTSEELNFADDITKQRIISRLMEMCIPYEVKGIDRRRKERAEINAKERKEILGVS